MCVVTSSFTPKITNQLLCNIERTYEVLSRHGLSLRQDLSLRWQNVSNLMHRLHVLSLRHVLLLRGDKTCRKVHSLHVLSLLRQQHYNLSFPSLVVCVCVCVCRCAFVRSTPACVLLCIVFIIPVSISARLKFCIAVCIYRLRGYCCP